MVQSIKDFLPVATGGGAGPIEDWAFTPALSALTANIASVTGGTVAAVSDRYTLTPAATIAEILPGSNVFSAVVRSSGAISADGAEYMDYIVPTYDVGDNVAFMGCGIMQNGNTFLDVFGQLSGNGQAGDYSYFLQQSAASGGITLVYHENGTTNQVNSLGNVVAGDRVQFGYNKNTGEILLKINAAAAQVIHTVPAGGRGEAFTTFMVAMATNGNVAFAAGSLDFTFSTTVNSLQGFQTLGAPALPAEAADGKRYKITTAGGLLFGKNVAQGDVVELISNTTDIIIHRAAAPATAEDVATATNELDTRLTSAELLLAAMGRTDDGVLAVDGHSQDGVHNAGADGQIFMVDPTIDPSGDLAAEGFVIGELYQYNHSGQTAAERLQKITVDIGQKITISTFDAGLGGSLQAPFIWSGGIQQIIDAAKAKNVNSNWVSGAGGTYGLIGAGWIPAPEIFDISVAAAGGSAIATVTITGGTGELSPTALQQRVAADSNTGDVNDRVTLTMGGTPTPGQFGYLHLTVLGTGSGASIVEFILPDLQRVTLGASVGSSARSTAIFKWYVDNESRVIFKAETIWEYADSMSRGHIQFSVAPTTYKVWEGRSFFALDNVDTTTFTLELPTTPGYHVGGNASREGTLEVMIMNSVATFAVDVSNVAGKSLIGKPIPASITAFDVLRFKYVDEYIVFLGVL